MSDLAFLALSRAGLPSFPGASYQEQLAAGELAARLALRKYAPGFAFDPKKADETLAYVEAWSERNSARLSAAYSDPSAETLARDLALELSADQARAFVIAYYTRAAYGLGPWRSDLISTVSSTWAQQDADTRLQVFGGLVKMDQDGFLAEIFSDAAPTGSGGFGLGPAAWIAIVAIVAVCATITVLVLASKKLSDSNRLMTDLCTKAQAEGNAAQVAQCIDATRGLQSEGLFPAVTGAVSKLVAVLVLVGAVYVGIQIWPWIAPKARARTS